MKHVNGTLTAALIFAAFVIGGCSSGNQEILTDYEQQLAAKQNQIGELESQLASKDSRIESLQGELMTAMEAEQRAYASMDSLRARDNAMAMAGDLFPPAKPGECYARVFVPARYEQVTEQYLAKEATSKVTTVPARYEWVEEQVLVKPASYRLEEVPAEYEWVEEQVLVKEAHTVWKKGRGPIEKIDSTTGEIMCLIEMPAEYKTVRKRVEVRPASTRRVEIPAEYETVKVRRVVEEAREERQEIPAEYQEVSRWVKVADERMEWREVVCETNLGTDLVRRLQIALRDAGHDPVMIDGIYGRRTRAAVESYQKAKGMPVGGLTAETLESLGL